MQKATPGASSKKKWEQYSDADRELVTLAMHEDAQDWLDRANEHVGEKRGRAIERSTCLTAATRKLTVRKPLGWVVRLGFWYAPHDLGGTPVDHDDAYLFSREAAFLRKKDLVDAGKVHPRCATVCRRYAKAK